LRRARPRHVLAVIVALPIEKETNGGKRGRRKERLHKKEGGRNKGS